MPKALTSTGDGVNAGTPQWSVITGNAALYYFSDTASDLASTLQMTTATYSPKTTLTYGLTVGTNDLQQWATNAGTPGATFAPAGAWVVHIHYSRSPAPIGTITLQAQINEVSATGTFIATIGTTEQSGAINPQGGEQEADLAFADSNPYTFASVLSRVQVIVQAISSSATPTASLYIGGTADAHLALPTSSGGGGVTAVTATLPVQATAGSAPVISLPFPATTVDISTPSNPAPGSTSWYTSGGKWCSLSPAGVENCTGAGGGGGDVNGPASSTAGHLATFADATGKLIQDGGAIPTGSQFNTQTDISGTTVNLGVYQNTTGAPILISAAISQTADGYTTAKTGATSTPNHVAAQMYNNNGAQATFSFIVPTSWYYTIYSGGTWTADYIIQWSGAGSGGGGGGPTTQTATSNIPDGTVYQNTGTTARYVNFSWRCQTGTGDAYGMTNSTNSLTNPTNIVSIQEATGTLLWSQTSFIVLPGWYYSITTESCTPNATQFWLEWQ